MIPRIFPSSPPCPLLARRCCLAVIRYHVACCASARRRLPTIVKTRRGDFGCLAVDVPLLHVGEMPADASSVGAMVVRERGRIDALLAGGIQDLYLHDLTIELDCPDFEVDADGGDVALRVCVIDKPQGQAWQFRDGASGKKPDRRLEDSYGFRPAAHNRER